MNKYAQYFAIEQKMKHSGIDIDRSELIADYTEGRTESLQDLSAREYRELIRQLNSLLGNSSYQEDKKQRMRRKVVATLCQCGYVIDGKADMERINGWCISHGVEHCPLNKYSLKGLQTLIKQAEYMLKSYIEKL
ncbi:MAG: hypothetical protein M9958_03310 [Chitinophagales bacterium]|nr:hypothetical protein [Chitinophagales bacterium]